MERPKNYQEFYQYYLREHSDPKTRAIHAWTTLIGVPIGAFMVLSGNWWGLLAFPIVYGILFASHFIFQGNRPTTLTYPVWSFFSDFNMTIDYFARFFREK